LSWWWGVEIETSVILSPITELRLRHPIEVEVADTHVRFA
jgi:hypothetical protein